jgi:hypothetical protein
MAVVEPPLGDEFLAGIEAGLERLRRHGLEVPRGADGEAALGRDIAPHALPEALGTAGALMTRDEASGPFTELFAEMVTVAIAARHTYGDEPLTGEQIERYLDHSYSIFNSFRHA